jgi:hypothetical protein
MWVDDRPWKDNVGLKLIVDARTGRITYLRESILEYLNEDGGGYQDFS